MLFTESTRFTLSQSHFSMNVKDQTNKGGLIDKITGTGRNAGNTLTDFPARYEVAQK